MPQILLRAITPKRAKVLDSKIFEEEIEKELKTRVKDKALRLLNRTVRTWTHKPHFQAALIGRGSEAVSLRIWATGPNAQIWNWVNLGTRPHIITIRNARSLRFMSGFRPKTRVRVLSSHRGGTFGSPVFRKRVRHPGTQAREFHIAVAFRLRDDFGRDIENAIRRAIRKSRGG